MERVLRKPVAFILTLSLILGMFIVPSFADGSQLYNEASVINGVDTSFEKQSEIAEVKTQSYDGARILNGDSHSGRFALKLGKSGLTESVFCHIINSSIDLSKYNQVSMWIKPKGYNIPFTLYTMVGGNPTTIGAIDVSNLKADTWQQVSFDLSGISGSIINGLSTYAYGNKSALIDDICFKKSFSKTEVWDLNAAGTNTLPTEMEYTSGMGVTLGKNPADPTSFNTDPKAGSIANSIDGQITDISIDSSVINNLTLSSTGQAVYLDNLVATNPALFALSRDCSKIYYYNLNTNCVEYKDRFSNTVKQIYSGQVSMVKTNEDGSLLAIVDTASALYLVKNPLTTNPANFSTQASRVTSGAIANVMFKGNNLYYVCNDYFYKTDSSGFSSKIIQSSYPERLRSLADPSNASQISGSTEYRYYYYSECYSYANYGLKYACRLRRHDNLTGTDIVIYSDGGCSTSGYSLSFLANKLGNVVIVNNNLIDANTATPVIIQGGISNYFFYNNNLYYTYDSKLHCYDNILRSLIIKTTDYIMDASQSGDNLLYVESYGNLYQISKTFSYDKGQPLKTATASAIFDYVPAGDAKITKVLYSTLPNQAVIQMENGDIYSVDTRSRTTRLLLNGMVLYDVLDGGKILLSDMKYTDKFVIYDPTTNNQEVFHLYNRSISSEFTIKFNEKANTVCYLNNENKLQEVILSQADTKDRYALMLNNDNKWWVYKNNAWKTIYTGSDCPSADLMDSMGMTAAEVDAITEKEFLKLPENTKADTLRIAVYFNSNSPYATPVLKSISVSTKDAEADLDSKTAYGTRIKEYNKADFRDISAIHVTENKDSTDGIYYFLVANDTPYSIRNGEVCNIGQTATQFFSNVKDNYLDIMAYGMSAKELSDLPAASLQEMLITNNTSDKFGIVAVIKTVNKDTKDVKLDYVLESLQKRFDDSVTTVKITLTDDTLIQYTTGEVTNEEIEKFADWVMDRKYGRGPVFFTFHVNGQYKVINYYMIKMFSVE